MDLVGGDLLALAGAPDHDAQIGKTTDHVASTGRTIGRVVDGLGTVRAEVIHLMAEGLQVGHDLDFEWVTGVIVGNGDLHGFLSIPSRPASSRSPTDLRAARPPSRRVPGRPPSPEGGWVATSA